MSDVHTPEARSRNMRAIRSADTRPEMLVRRALHAAGFRYRLGGAGLPGRPDLVLPRLRTVVFVHGCFWHGHTGCRYFKVPGTRTDFWLQKIGSNQRRDAVVEQALQEQGWKVVVVWECALKASGQGVAEVVRQLQAFWLARADSTVGGADPHTLVFQGQRVMLDAVPAA